MYEVTTEVKKELDAQEIITAIQENGISVVANVWGLVYESDNAFIADNLDLPCGCPLSQLAIREGVMGLTELGHPPLADLVVNHYSGSDLLTFFGAFDKIAVMDGREPQESIRREIETLRLVGNHEVSVAQEVYDWCVVNLPPNKRNFGPRPPHQVRIVTHELFSQA